MRNRNRLILGLLENVEGILDGAYPTNLDHVLSDLDNVGIWCLAVQMDPHTMLDLHVSRRRIWFPHMLDAALDDVCEADRIHLFRIAIGIVMGASQSIGINQIILPESHPLVQRMYTELVSNTPSPEALYASMAKKRKVTKWPMPHYNIALSRGTDWTQPFLPNREALASSYQGLLALGVSDLSSLQLHGVTIPETEPRTVDLSKHFQRQVLKANSICCLCRVHSLGT